jgi:hypothetical protein
MTTNRSKTVAPCGYFSKINRSSRLYSGCTSRWIFRKQPISISVNHALARSIVSLPFGLNVTSCSPVAVELSVELVVNVTVKVTCSTYFLEGDCVAFLDDFRTFDFEGSSTINLVCSSTCVA